MSVTRQTTLQQIKGHLSTTGNCVYVESLGNPSNVAQIHSIHSPSQNSTPGMIQSLHVRL